jgi:myo-inositol-1(or 4)-monophosphatase
MPDPFLQVAQEAAAEAGQIITRYYRDGVTMREKQPCDLVSDADVDAEKAVVAVIRRHFPKHAMLAEEGHRDAVTEEHLWVIDPLDGTTNFAHRVPHFAVSIAYCYRGEPQCGVIYNPMRDDWYTAVRGGGALHNGRRVHVADHRRLDQTLVGVGFYYDRGELMEATLDALRKLLKEQVHGIRRMGAAALDLCAVGVGSFGAFFEYTLSAWDYAAGQLFVAEAGGKVTTCEGTPLDLKRTSVLATNGHLHPAMLEIVPRSTTV